MSKEFAPILDVTPRDAKRHWPNDLLDILELYQGNDEFTYTMRIAVPEDKRDSVKVLLERHEEDTTDLIAFLEGNDWNVSFLVDCY